MNDVSAPPDPIAAALDDGDYYAARAGLAALLDAGASTSRLRALAGRIARLPADFPVARPMRIALLATWSSEYLHDALVVAAFRAGVRAQVTGGAFGAFRQELLDPASALYAAAPDVLILSLAGEDLAPDYWSGSVAADPFPALETELRTLLTALRARSTAAVLIHNLAPPAWPIFGSGDATLADGQRAAVHRFNARLAVLAGEVGGVYVVDYAALVARHGEAGWSDERMRHHAHLPLARASLVALAREQAKLLRILAGGAKKCLVVDLDNTLWGGVLGEDGVDGIALDTVHPGVAYRDFQRLLIALHDRGVLLAIASKNNPADVEEAFARHPHMQLTLDHFAAREIGWMPKSASLEAIAARLGIGLEHIVFVDDNPVELAEVARALPMVETVRFPEAAETFARALLAEGWFDDVRFSAEDRDRARLYRQRAQAETLRDTAAGGLEGFLISLDMEIAVEPTGSATLARTAQLTQKTNQLNLTTRRYTEADVAARIADPAWEVLTARVRDRFGDNGLIGVMMAQAGSDALDIDSFLLSCRVIGRGVETAMLAALCDAAAARGLARLTATLIPTPKNMPARAILPDHGFVSTGTAGDASHWALDLAAARVAWPAWFQVAARP